MISYYTLEIFYSKKSSEKSLEIITDLFEYLGPLILEYHILKFIAEKDLS